MSKNVRRTLSAEIIVNAAVPLDGMGKVVPLGTGGLHAYMLTNQATAPTIADGTAAPGLAVNEASCELIGVHMTCDLTVVGTSTLFAAVYHVTASPGTYSFTSASNTKIGYWLGAAGVVNGIGEVGLTTS